MENVGEKVKEIVDLNYSGVKSKDIAQKLNIPLASVKGILTMLGLRNTRESRILLGRNVFHNKVTGIFALGTTSLGSIQKELGLDRNKEYVHRIVDVAPGKFTIVFSEKE